MHPHSSCYPYAMDNCHDASNSPSSPKIARPPRPAQIIFDGTKLSVDRSRPKTTTYGINHPFQPFSISQNCPTFNPTFAPASALHATTNPAACQWHLPPGEVVARLARRVRAPAPPLRSIASERLLHRG